MVSKAKAAAAAASKARKAAPKTNRAVPKTTSFAEVQPAEPEPALKLVDVKSEGGKLFVTVEGTDLRILLTPAARALAYEERLKHGMANAGIEVRGGSYVDDAELAAAAEEKRDVERWRCDFLLTQMI